MKLKVHPGWNKMPNNNMGLSILSLSRFWPFKNVLSSLASPIRAVQSQSCTTSGALFTYFHNGQIRRVQCSMKHFIPSDSCSSVSVCTPILNSLSTRRISMAGKQRIGAQNSFASVLILLSVQWSSSLRCQGLSCKAIWQLSFCNSVKYSPLQSGPWQHKFAQSARLRWFFNSLIPHALISNMSVQQK